MWCMHPAKWAIFVKQQLIRCVFLVLRSRVVTTLATATCQGHDISHHFILYKKLPCADLQTQDNIILSCSNQPTSSLITPAPTVRPPSRMAKRNPASIAIGVIKSISADILSPGITISTPSSKVTTPVTSVVLK